jgi:membrane-associated phospholipid phosphatase
MKKLLFLLLFVHTAGICQLIEKPSQNSNNNTAFDSTHRVPLMIAGGGILISPIQTISKQKSSVNFTVPVIVTGAGMLMMSSSMHRAQTDWRNKTAPSYVTSVDDYLAFVPNIAGVGLGILGVKAKHNFKDRMLVAVMANGIMLATVNGLKYTTKIQRPDKSTNNSFPSGHTAFAFTGAEIINQEYGDQSIIYSIVGYAIGGTTGTLRVLNNRHWVSDVVAGAGIGMLSTKIAYKLLPWAKRKLYKNENVAILPMYLPKGFGVGMALTLK